MIAEASQTTPCVCARVNMIIITRARDKNANLYAEKYYVEIVCVMRCAEGMEMYIYVLVGARFILLHLARMINRV